MQRVFIFVMLLAGPMMADDIRQIDGTTYHRARVTQVDPDGIVILHEKGTVKIEFAKLPPEMRERYGYDERKAGIFRRQQASRATDLAEEDQRVLKAHEERELARIQKQMENGASGDELIYGSKGGAGGAAAAFRKSMEAHEEARIAKEREPVTFWNSPQPVARVLRTVLKGFCGGGGDGGDTRNGGRGADGGYFPGISHLERPDVPVTKTAP
jgi:hypothetical protein